MSAQPAGPADLDADLPEPLRQWCRETREALDALLAELAPPGRLDALLDALTADLDLDRTLADLTADLDLDRTPPPWAA